MKKTIIILMQVLLSISVFGQLQSPEQFLGYKIGTRYTPHHQIVAYFKHVAENSKMVKLQFYGETNEHRPLMVAFVSTEQTISNLENIRINNLKLAHQSNSTKEATTQTPTITWLSYNVHGNEPTSSEAALQTLFALVDPSNSQTKTWLSNSLVVIDPCLNPDGRDRYVNWYNGVVGKYYDTNPISREHVEPWPRGRSNHYNFDLNRDWAWQTQKESQQRVALYNQWLPQVHVDFHEQGYDAPYYFAPAAEPYHDVLTKWQREFQKVIGKNNAKYFDQNHWLYFTKERFDLFYPSYGDTYPLYNGSIGMTYEQGGINGGLGVETSEGDTLTLVERVSHHYTTGLSTIEAASQNATQLVQNFKTYFDDAVQGKTGAYKTFVIKNKLGDEDKINRLKNLLEKNKIQYGTSSGTGKGYNYNSKKEESFTIGQNDLVISMQQPKAALAQVLFEPVSRLTDSITYDITAWAIPYVYGLEGFASKQNFKVDEKQSATINTNPSGNPYAYIIPWTGFNAAKTVSALLKEGIRLRFSEKEFESNKQKFNAGSVIVSKTGNSKFGNGFDQIIRTIANENNVKLFEANSGMAEAGSDFGSEFVHALKAPNVYLLTGDNVSSNAAGEVWSFFDNELNYPITLINTAQMPRLDWSRVDVLIMPDGNYDFLMNRTITEQLTSWVRGGGRIVALESAVQQLSRQNWSILKQKNINPDTTNKKDSVWLSDYGSREKNYVSETTPGAIFKVNIDNSHPLMFGYPNYYYTLKMDANIYEPIKDGGWNTGIIKDEKQLAGFVGTKLSKNLKNGVLFAVQDMGRGHIVYLADNVIFRNFWENGKLMLINAVFMVGQ